MSTGDVRRRFSEIRAVAALPFGPFMNWETYALADEMEVLKAEVEIMKKAEQAFPAQK